MHRVGDPDLGELSQRVRPQADTRAGRPDRRGLFQHRDLVTQLLQGRRGGKSNQAAAGNNDPHDFYARRSKA